jgi:hypothetical protein
MTASQYDEITSLAAVSLCSDDRRDTTIRFDVISNTSSTVVIEESSACWETFVATAYRVINSGNLNVF